jgi:hypothetical protein
LNQHIVDYLGAVTLQHLVNQQKSRGNGTTQVHDMRGLLARTQAHEQEATEASQP